MGSQIAARLLVLVVTALGAESALASGETICYFRNQEALYASKKFFMYPSPDAEISSLREWVKVVSSKQPVPTFSEGDLKTNPNIAFRHPKDKEVWAGCMNVSNISDARDHYKPASWSSITKTVPIDYPDSSSAPSTRGAEAGARIGALIGGQQLERPQGTAEAGAEAESVAYKAAFDMVLAGRYDEAAKQFTQFLQSYPSSAQTPNALYWLGDSYYASKRFALAQQQYQTLLGRFPAHDKAPGALLKVGLSQQGLGRTDDATATLSEVVARYPGTDAARTADSRLKAIGSTGAERRPRASAASASPSWAEVLTEAVQRRPTPSATSRVDRAVTSSDSFSNSSSTGTLRAPLAPASCARYSEGRLGWVWTNNCSIPIEVQWCWVPSGKSTCKPSSTSRTLAPGEEQLISGPIGDEQGVAAYCVCDMRGGGICSGC